MSVYFNENHPNIP